jgi:hypothetical protein
VPVVAGGRDPYRIVGYCAILACAGSGLLGTIGVDQLVQGLEGAGQPGDVRGELVAFFEQLVVGGIGGGCAR